MNKESEKGYKNKDDKEITKNIFIVCQLCILT